MTKSEFLSALRSRLSALSSDDRERSVDFYSEMIADRMEDGMTETEAVANMGDLSRITSQILSQGLGNTSQSSAEMDTRPSCGVVDTTCTASVSVADAPVADAPAASSSVADVPAASAPAGSPASSAPAASASASSGFAASSSVADASTGPTGYALRNPWVVGFLSPFILVLWAVVFACLTAFWALVVALHVVGIATGASGIALHVVGTALFFVDRGGEGLLIFGAGVFLVGFTVLLSLGCKYATLGMAKATKWTVWGLIRMILRKERAV
ncbi:MAG: DUF1700 domain-containing protein [Clostridia bacterium]|nr:DUF1700 domain-containing protein [Clostridia bacterium]